jgi:hypothetical protein
MKLLCKICHTALEPVRQDYICEYCRFERICLHRLQREALEPAAILAVFARKQGMSITSKAQGTA